MPTGKRTPEPEAEATTPIKRPRKIEVMQADGRVYVHKYAGTNGQLDNAIKAGRIKVQAKARDTTLWVLVNNALQITVEDA